MEWFEIADIVVNLIGNIAACGMLSLIGWYFAEKAQSVRKERKK